MQSAVKKTITCSACRQIGHSKRSKDCPQKKHSATSTTTTSMLNVAPALTSVEAPALTSVEAPALTSVETPALTSVETPALTSVETPALTSVETPALTSVETPALTSVETPAVKLKTEDLGKIFEKAICNLFRIPYDGKYIYTQPENEAKCSEIVRKLTSLKNLVPSGQIYHTAKNGARYDFTFTDEPTGESKNLSAKTTKRDGKIAPQVIGQPSIAKFCHLVGCSETHPTALKQYIQSSENIQTILQLLYDNTFSCPVVYYNEVRDDIKYITAKRPINWQELNIEWTRSHELWTNSSTMKVVKPGTTKSISLVEFQFHTKRKNMAIRWFFENLISFFSDGFEIIQIHKKSNTSPSTIIDQTTAIASTLTKAPVKKNESPVEHQPKREMAPKRLLLVESSG